MHRIACLALIVGLAACQSAEPAPPAATAASPSPAALPAFVIVPPGANVPSDMARFSGTWLGVWDGRFPAIVAVKRIAPDGAAEIEYRWVEREGQDYSVSPTRTAQIENGVLKFGGITLQIDPADPSRAYGELRGRNELGPVHRTSRFYRG
jgi:hypothetical protein